MGSSIISITFSAHTQVKIYPPTPIFCFSLVHDLFLSVALLTFGTNVWKGCPVYFNMSQKPWDSSDASGNPLPSCDNSADPTQTKLAPGGNCCSSLACPFALTYSEVSTTLASPGFLKATQLLPASRAGQMPFPLTRTLAALSSTPLSAASFCRLVRILTSVTTSSHVHSSEEFPECFALTATLRPPSFSADLGNY